MANPSSSTELLKRDDCLLVVIDMQAKLLPEIVGAAEVVRSCRRMVRAAGVLGVPVIYTEQYPRGLGPTVAELATWIGDGGPIEKTAFGCYDCAEFAQRVAEVGKRTLLLCGIEAHICVCQTALQSLSRGHRVYLLEDAIGARSSPAREVGIARMRVAGALPSHTEMAIYELLGAAATTEFRAILPIIKEEASPSAA